MGSVRRVVVVGGGAAGALSALHLHRGSVDPVQVSVVEPRAQLGRGVAYGTDHPAHLLNVRADCLSALPELPGHFAAWAAAGGAEPGGGAFELATSFLPRMRYGDYLHDVLGPVDHVRDSVLDVAAEHGGVRVELAGGASLRADHVVLALGSSPGSWPSGLTSGWPAGASRQVVGDPWAPGALDELDPAGADLDRPVVLLGTGLTAVDVAISLHGRGYRRFIATSRHGLLPRAHRPRPRPVPALIPPPEPTARGLLAWAREGADRVGAWELVVEALRPQANGLWAALDPSERARLVRHLHRHWEVLRHRMAPEVAERIAAMQAAGELTVVPGGVRRLHHTAGGPEVVLADRTVRAAAVINCTGPSADVRRSGTPLVRRLLATGVVRPGPLALGVDTDARGCVPGTGGALWVVGPLRRGGVWETTAIPEIREQAARLPALLAASPQPARV